MPQGPGRDVGCKRIPLPLDKFMAVTRLTEYTADYFERPDRQSCRRKLTRPSQVNRKQFAIECLMAIQIF